MKTLLQLLALIMLLTACSGKTEEAKQRTDTTQMMVMQIQQCARLYTTQVKMRKVITLDDTRRIEAKLLNHEFNINVPGGKRKIAIPIDATAKAYIDFATFNSDNITRDGNKIEIILPNPQLELTETRIDHDGIMKYVGLARKDFNDEEITALQQQGRDSIVAALAQLNIGNDAKANATRVIVPMLTKMGYKENDVTITFRKDFSINNILQNIKDTK